jgi:hypothetical protein
MTDYSKFVIWQSPTHDTHSDSHTILNSIELFDLNLEIQEKKIHTSSSLKELKEAFNYGVETNKIRIDKNNVIQAGCYRYDVTQLKISCSIITDSLPFAKTSPASEVFFKIGNDGIGQKIVKTGFFIIKQKKK